MQCCNFMHYFSLLFAKEFKGPQHYPRPCSRFFLFILYCDRVILGFGGTYDCNKFCKFGWLIVCMLKAKSALFSC